MRPITTTLTDEEIIGNLLLDREVDHSLKYLYRTHYPFLSKYILANSGSADDASDIFQEVIIAFINLVKNKKFRGEASIKTFLFALNRNLWLNELKRRGRSQARELKYEKLGDREEAGINTVIENREVNDKLMGVLESLGENCKKILLLYYY